MWQLIDDAIAKSLSGKLERNIMILSFNKRCVFLP
jgi:hypothetical protein